jgi:hypothetical protein
MKHALGSALLVVALSLSTSPGSAQPLGDLVHKVSQGSDFRVRVQAALELGKTKGRVSRLALEAALDDENAAVRAAAAAGLKVMGDTQALAALVRHEGDSSPAVRAQIKNSEDSLRKADAPKPDVKTEVFVQLGKIRSGGANGTSGGTVLEDVARASKLRLRELPGIALVDDDYEPPAPSKSKSKKGLPTVMLTGSVKRLEQSSDGSSMTYLASVEFVLHKMPGQTIKGVVSGSARASGSVGGQESIADLRRSAIEAAVESAVRRAPQALRAAAQ